MMMMLGAWIGAAHACSFPPLTPLSVDATRTDGIGPTLSDVEVDIVRGTAGHDTPRGWQVSSCDDLGLVELTLHDEGSAGLALDWIAGRVPSDLLVPEQILAGPSVLLHWVDGAVDDQEPVDFTLQITPFDAGGDAGEPVLVQIVDPGSGACSTGLAPSPWLAIVGVGLCAGMRRRR